jgi:hypothetical protein
LRGEKQSEAGDDAEATHFDDWMHGLFPLFGGWNPIRPLMALCPKKQALTMACQLVPKFEIGKGGCDARLQSAGS